MKSCFRMFSIRALVACTTLLFFWTNAVDGNLFMDTFQSCSQSFNGFSYDLTPMVRTAGHRDYVLTGANGEIVFINICAQVQNVPSSCRRDPDAIRGNAYVELNPSEGQICRSLGSSVHWRPIDDKNPDLGVDLIYSGGDVCTDGKTASARIRVLCDRDHTMGVPEDYPVERDRSSPCSYIVTWPSLYGCPIRSSSYFMIYSLIFVAVALFLVRSGCCSGIFQTDSIHEDDSNDGFGTSQATAPSICASVLLRIREAFHVLIARLSARARSNSDVYDL